MRDPQPRLRYVRALCILAALAWAQPAPAQPRSGEAGLSLPQAERSATDLHRGMSVDEVRKLLGKPKRTGLKDDGATAASRGALRWTYIWAGTFGPSTLHVDFVSDTPEDWRVRGWEWAAY